jgi:hypothetical protein
MMRLGYPKKRSEVRFEVDTQAKRIKLYQSGQFFDLQPTEWSNERIQAEQRHGSSGDAVVALTRYRMFRLDRVTGDFGVWYLSTVRVAEQFCAARVHRRSRARKPNPCYESMTTWVARAYASLYQKLFLSPPGRPRQTPGRQFSMRTPTVPTPT